MNATLINKYFKNAWRQRVFVERHEDRYWVSDSNVMLNLPLNASLFNDRAIFHELPENGESFTYSKISGIVNSGANLVRLAKDMLDPRLKLITIAPWVLVDVDTFRCRLLLAGNQKIVLDQKFFDWFDLTPNAFGVPGSMRPVILSETATESPLLFGEITAIIAQLSTAGSTARHDALAMINPEY